MNQRDVVRLAQIVIECELAISAKRQSMKIWRGDMRAIVAAYKEIQTQRMRKADERGRV